jgi:hypothetical protein
MRIAFLLRFQEPCTEDTPTPLAGTQTITRSRAEGNDTDPGSKAHSIFPNELEISTEPKDKQNIAIPMAATRTKTFSKAETDDRDAASKNLRIVPRCS